MPSPTVTGTLHHLLPTQTRGTELLPLAQMRTQDPNLYERHARKYEHRPEAMDELIPPLSCTWSEVVFLSPVHPRPLFEALQRSGRTVPRAEPATLDASQLDPTRCTIRLMRHGASGHYPDPADEDDYLPFTTAGLRAVREVTVAAIERLANLGPTDPWLPWVDVPHILHRGPIPLDLFVRAERSATEH